MKRRNKISEISFHIIFYWLLIPGLILICAPRYKRVSLSLYWDNVIYVSAVIIVLVGMYIALKSALQYFVKSDSLPIIGKVPKHLIRRGLYRRSRHPFFIGHCLMVIGIALFTRSLIFMIISFLYIFMILFILKFVKESKIEKEFGQEYIKYQQKTPFIWSFKKNDSKYPTLLKLLFYPLLRLMERFIFPTEIEGRENIPEEEGALFISNHLSYLDPFFISSYCHHDIHFFTTADVFRNKLMAWFLREMGSIRVKKFEKDPGAIRKLIRHLRHGKSVGYFPEGKRTWNGSPGKFPEGIARVLKIIDKPVIPVSLCGLDSFLPRWSDTWRRTKVKIIFHQPMNIDREWSDYSIESMMYKLLHAPNKNFEHKIFTKRNLNQGIERLFWRCPNCGAIGTINPKGNCQFFCKECESKWEITHRNTVKQIDKGETIEKSIQRWYADLEKYPLPDFQENRKYYPLKSGKCILETGEFSAMEKIDRGFFSFSREKIVFLGEKKKYSWEFQKINSISDPGNKVLQLTYKDQHIRFKFLEGSSLKWIVILSKYTSENKLE